MCLDDQILNTYVDGELAQPWKSQVEEHLEHCRACQLRLRNIEHLKSIVKKVEISEEEIKERQDRVLAIIEKNHHAERKVLPFNRRISVKVSQLVGAAAAFTFIFVGSWAIVNSNSESSIPLPNAVPSVVNISDITPTRNVNQEVYRTLESYSLEDILKSLDARGYDVDIRLKGIQPIEEFVPEQAEDISEN